jgi:hypothetical protein
MYEPFAFHFTTSLRVTMPAVWSNPVHGELLLAGAGKRPAPEIRSRVSKQRVTEGSRIVAHLAAAFPTILRDGHAPTTQVTYTSGVRFFREFSMSSVSTSTALGIPPR